MLLAMQIYLDIYAHTQYVITIYVFTLYFITKIAYIEFHCLLVPATSIYVAGTNKQWNSIAIYVST